MATTIKPSLPRGATRRKILSTLKKSDGLTADQLAGLLGITSMAVRKHLAALENDDLIESTLERRAIGRPANLYRVAPLAEDFFPKQYDMVITELLTDLVQIDGERKVNLLLERRAERTCEFLRERIGHAKTLGERVAALTEGMDELGYLAVWEQCDESTYFIKQYNCAINRVAACFPVACNYEAQMFRQLLDADVERASHVLAGDHLCGYVIRARTPLGNAASNNCGCSCMAPD
ncbi:MAG TPA: metalloregulator ArsR/SmtB family transcription factor [Nitrolancea sp.]|nr:metalloregulator ArsR/SmtB family transcription factor [Nitrolancea sp.]